MSNPPGAADRALRLCLLAGFWIPLAGCTVLALAPSPPTAVFRISDVVLHGFAFTYLTFALGLAYGGLRPVVVALCMLGYGLLLEFVQSFEPARSAELKDVLVDGVGIALGLALLVALGGWSRRLLRAVLAAALPGGNR